MREAVEFYTGAFSVKVPYRSPSPSGEREIGVPDVDSAYQRAVDHGALPALPPTGMFWGDRYGWVRDPFGHIWALCSIREILTPDEVAARMQAGGGSTKEQNR